MAHTFSGAKRVKVGHADEAGQRSKEMGNTSSILTITNLNLDPWTDFHESYVKMFFVVLVFTLSPDFEMLPPEMTECVQSNFLTN